ncbi:MAG TPA: histone deacetylase [Steroidobacter sp.]|uniref:histone deacetylase family protein n=1 Tax=Steroidobacter sp. TaxID=1978227 RepID=UPI002EDA2337
MKVVYSDRFNIDLGLLNYLHPFDGTKFRTVHDGLRSNRQVEFVAPSAAASMEIIDDFLSEIMRLKVRNKVFIYRALEVPSIPFVGFSFLDRKILTPMRWGVAGTILGATSALKEGGLYWNLAGGYHHAAQQSMEGFCIYNDIGICHRQLVKNGLLAPDDKILIIDTDAHHGNGNAYTFMENENVTILDVYNASIYPTSGYTRDRVNIPVPLKPGTDGPTYLKRYAEALDRLKDDFRLAFVVAGTDVLLSDKLGGLCLSIDEVAERERRTVEAIERRSIPAVVLGGGGYSKDSAKSIIRAISACTEREISRLGA